MNLTSIKSANNQKSGINLLKYLAAFFVIFQHSLSAFLSAKSILIPVFLPILVNNNTIFIIITGFFLISKDSPKSKFLEIMIYGGLLMIFKGFLLADYTHGSNSFFVTFIRCVFDYAWYYYAVIIIYCFYPFFANYVKNDFNHARYWILSLFLVLTFYITILGILSFVSDSFKLDFFPQLDSNQLYHSETFVKLFIWFLLGCIIKIYGWTNLSKNRFKKNLLYLALSVICYSFLFMSLYKNVSNTTHLAFASMVYIWTPIFSVCIFIMFSQITLKSWWINEISKTSLFIYLMNKVVVLLVARWWLHELNEESLCLISAFGGISVLTSVGWLYKWVFYKKIFVFVKWWDQKWLLYS